MHRYCKAQQGKEKKEYLSIYRFHIWGKYDCKNNLRLRNDTETMPLGDPILVAKLLIFHSILRFCLLFSCYLRKQAGHKAHS